MIIKNISIGYGTGILRGITYEGVTFEICNRTKFVDCKFKRCTFTNNRHVEFKNCDIDKYTKMSCDEA